jgi:hypothetical protein
MGFKTDFILLNLKIISKIPENCKISIDSKGNLKLMMNNTGAIGSIKRFLFRDSRTKSIEGISNIIESSINLCKEVIDSSVFQRGQQESVQVDYFSLDTDFINKYSLLTNLYIELKASIAGLLNLKNHYCSDITTISKLDIIISKIQNFITILEKKHIQY